MTPLTMAYGIVLGILLVAAAHFLESALRTLGHPARWAWILALGAASLLPVLLLLSPSSVPAGTWGAVPMPLEALYNLGLEPGGVASGGRGMLASLDKPLLLIWMLASGLVLLTLASIGLRLRGRAARWPRKETGGLEVLVSEDTGPAVVGLLRPRVVLPSWAFGLEPEELEMVLLHEEEHLRARDPVLLAGALLALALAPWNPALWWGLRRLRLAVEADCDARVLDRGVGLISYAALLLGVASASRRLFPLVPALVEPGSTFLERRLRMMRHHVGKKRVFGAAAGAVVAGVFLFLACETPVPPTPVEPQLDVTSAPAQEVAEPESFQVLVNPEKAEVVSQDRSSVSGDLLVMEKGQRIKLRPIAEAGGSSGDPPLVYVDGVLQEGGMAAAQELDPEMIERIEVVKGQAARAIFGEEAAAGVIQIFLKK